MNYSATPFPAHCTVNYTELEKVKQRALLTAVRTNKPHLVIWKAANSIWLKDNTVVAPPNTPIQFTYIEYLPQLQFYKNWYSVTLYCKESIPTPILGEDNSDIDKEIAKYYTPYQAECYLNGKLYYAGSDPYYTEREPQYMRASFYINH